MHLHPVKNIDPHAAHLAENEIITGTWTFNTHPLNLDHDQIANIGDNSHDDIDVHIADTSNPHSVSLEQARTQNNQLSGGIDFNKYKAIAMVCDNGATLPSTPTTGQWFLHTPINRSILYMYNGSDWIPLARIGPVIVYVDDDVGTDDLNKGYNTGSNAFATIQFALSSVEGTIGKDVTINVSGDIYNELPVVTGIGFAGDYKLYIIGDITVEDTQENADIFSANTIGDSSKSYGVNAHKYNVVEITGGTGEGQRFAIVSNTATTLVIAAKQWITTPNGTSDYRIINRNTTLDGEANRVSCIKLDNQVGVIMKYFILTGSTVAALNMINNSRMEFWGGWIKDTGLRLAQISNSVFSATGSAFESRTNQLSDLSFSNSGGLLGRDYDEFNKGGNYHYAEAGMHPSTSQIFVNKMSDVLITNSLIDGNDKSAIGYLCASGGNNGIVRTTIKNCNLGVEARSLCLISMVDPTYINNNTDTSQDLALSAHIT